MTVTFETMDDYIYSLSKKKHKKYISIKQELYQEKPELKKAAYHKMTPLSHERKREIKTKIRARKSLIEALALDFPSYNNKQLGMVIDGKSYQEIKRARTLSQEERNLIITKYVDDLDTINNIASLLDVSYKKIKKCLQDNGLLGVKEDERKKLKRIESIKHLPKKVSVSSKLSKRNKGIKDNISLEYIDKIPSWAFDFVNQVPSPFWFDKLYITFTDKRKIIEFLQLCQEQLGRLIAISELDVIFPPIKQIKNVSRLIYTNFANDNDIKKLTKISSQYESQIQLLLNDIGVEFEINNHSILKDEINNELDFYIPKMNIAIEVSPIRTHNSNNHKDIFFSYKEPTYHARKQQKCEQLGIKLITLFQKDLISPTWEHVTIPMIRRLLTNKVDNVVYARKTVIKPIPTTVGVNNAKEFCIKYHLDGYVASKFAFGVFDNNDNILGVFTLGVPANGKFKKENFLELKRLAWKSNVQVRYGVSKIINYISNNFSDKYNGLMTFSSNNIGWGQGYQKSGMEFVHRTSPSLKFINPNHPQDNYSWAVATSWGAKQGVIAKRIHPMTITNKQAREIVETQLPWRVGNGKGYVAQYDCGNMVWMKYFK